jgi:hypothetical protein
VLCALGRIGQAFQVAHDVAVAYAKYRFGDQLRDVTIDGEGGIVGVVVKALHTISFVHTVQL